MHARTTTPEPQGSTDAARERGAAAAIKALAHPNTQHLTELDHQLVAAFFDPDRNLVDIARDHDLKVVALAAWSKQPHIRDILESIAELASFRAKVLSAERAALAVRTLDHCAAQVFAADMADPNIKPGARNARLGEARRAANAILRHAAPTPQPRSAAPAQRKPRPTQPTPAAPLHTQHAVSQQDATFLPHENGVVPLKLSVPSPLFPSSAHAFSHIETLSGT